MDDLLQRRLRKEFPGPVDLDCDSCNDRQYLGALEVYPRPGDDLRTVVEAAAETEHFLATGCNGRIRLRTCAGTGRKPTGTP